MRADALATVLKLRRHALEQARCALADALAVQDEAERVLVAAEQAIAHEMAQASEPGPGDGAVEAFAAWLPGARRRVAMAQRVLEDAVSDSAKARATVNLARAGLEATEAIEAAQVAEKAERVARTEQQAIDDAARRRRRHDD